MTHTSFVDSSILCISGGEENLWEKPIATVVVILNGLTMLKVPQSSLYQT